MFSTFLLVIVLFKMALKHSVEVLASVPEGCEVPYGEMCVSDPLHSGMSYIVFWP